MLNLVILYLIFGVKSTEFGGIFVNLYSKKALKYVKIAG